MIWDAIGEIIRAIIAADDEMAVGQLSFGGILRSCARTYELKQ